MSFRFIEGNGLYLIKNFVIILILQKSNITKWIELQYVSKVIANTKHNTV